MSGPENGAIYSQPFRREPLRGRQERAQCSLISKRVAPLMGSQHPPLLLPASSLPGLSTHAQPGQSSPLHPLPSCALPQVLALQAFLDLAKTSSRSSSKATEVATLPGPFPASEATSLIFSCWKALGPRSGEKGGKHLGMGNILTEISCC